LGDIPRTAFKANGDEAEGGGKGGAAWGAAAPNFNDSDWRQLDLPHDWIVELPFDRNADRSHGYRSRGVGWYRRTFALPSSDQSKHLELKFDGVSTHCSVWFNGFPVQRNWCGYTSFSIDVSALATYGNALNTMAIRVDAEDMEGWWYEGGGIYRHTWLVKTSPVHIVTDGVHADPVRGSDGRWTLPVEATIENSGNGDCSTEVVVTLFDPHGNRVGEARVNRRLASWERAMAKLSIPVTNPRLWSVDHPVLYRLSTKVLSGGHNDEVSTQCGFRTIRFDAKRGFFLNDKPLKIQGVCCHQDHAGVGVAVPDSLWEFRIRKLKEMGANAYRCAHNPPAKEFLDACDRMGMLVMDENRHFNASDDYLEQLRWMVRRDRNHPSVILWSLFNEENSLEGSNQGRAMVRRMMHAVKALDATRPITGAQNGGQLVVDKLNPQSVALDLDVVGINYQVDKYAKIRAAYPDKPMLSSEDTSQVMTRGAYSTDFGKAILASYDDRYPGWASNNREGWAAIMSQPSFAGGFIWTGFDYHGEPSPFGWPARSSFFGCLDLCGFPKTAFFIRQALWIHDRPVLSLVPHWNWTGRTGEPIRVMAYTNAQSVALFLNRKLVAEKPVDPLHSVEWMVPYSQGKLEAVAMNGGKVVTTTSIETTGEPVALRLIPDRDGIRGDGEDAVPITVEVVDSEGRPVPTANLPVEFELTGPGDIIGLGNGDPDSDEPEKGNRRSLFNGLAQVILRSKRNTSGDLTLTARAAGFRTSTIQIKLKAVPPIPCVPVPGRS
jgi:beta-galactosidase